MNEYKYTGGCHCGNIVLEMKLSSELNSYIPRTCDCDFCLKHGASYISDKNGGLAISVKQESELNRYKHGDKIAYFLICQICGVLVGAYYEYQEHLYGTVNSRVLKNNSEFKQYTLVSPKKLNSTAKNQRWKDVWFSNVVLINFKLYP